VRKRAQAQLRALAEVASELEASKIDYWLFGGWAVDFHAGRMTRAHDDVDVAVWFDDVSRIDRLLRDTGWTHVPSPSDDGGTGYERGGVRLELTFLVRRDGTVVIPLRRGDAAWPDPALEGSTLELLGTSARAMTLEALWRTKSPPRSDPDDEPKDRADSAVLSQLRAEGNVSG
jgi:hypothetical protein